MNTKYKIQETTGCMSASFTFNGKEWYEYSENEQEEILDYLLDKIREEIDDGSILINNVVNLFQYDDWEDLGRCDTCFDNVMTTTYNI